MGWRIWNKTSTERQTGGRNNAVGPPVCFLKAIPREIFSIKFAKPAPRGNHGCTRTIPLKNAQVRAIRHELRGAFCLRLYGVSLFAGSMLYILGTMIKMPQNTILEHAIRTSYTPNRYRSRRLKTGAEPTTVQSLTLSVMASMRGTGHLDDQR